jgi:hypothetical protein
MVICRLLPEVLGKAEKCSQERRENTANDQPSIKARFLRHRDCHGFRINDIRQGRREEI